MQTRSGPSGGLTNRSKFTYTRTVPVSDKFDVIVVGGGPSGLAAAIAASRNGARTRLIERFGFLGGNMTAALVGPCMTSFSLDGKTQLIAGVFDEFVKRMEDVGGAVHPSKTHAGDPYAGFMTYGHDKVTPFEPEAAKSVAIDMCVESGVDIRLHSFVADAIVHEGEIRGVLAVSKGGFEFLPAEIVIDCSGDGDVAAASGVRMLQGRPADGLCQPMTLFFRVSGVRDDVVSNYVRDHPEDSRLFEGLVSAARENGVFPVPRRNVAVYKTLRPGVWRVNTTRVLKRDGTNVEDLTAAEIEARKQALDLVDFFRKHLPGFDQCELYDTASTIGVRESRRIEGEFELTLNDLQTGRHFEDVIALCGYPVDLHDPTGPIDGMDPSYNTANTYEIPFRSLVPKGVGRLLVAGRCVSASHEALGAIRVMPPAFAMGQAAGTAAALAVRTASTPGAIDVHELQRLLRCDGAFLGRWV